ncbi:MAG: DUF3726 domain-containing protein [Hyphomicrobiaceae bacterium]
MQCSDNELEMTLRKAVLGAGYKFGTAVDVARAGVWLSRRGFDGIEAILAALQSEPAAVKLERVNGDAVIPAAKAIAAGPAAVDLAIASDAATRVRLDDVDSPNLVLGLAGVAAGDFSRWFTFDCDGTSIEIDFNTTSLQTVPSDCSQMTLAVGGTKVSQVETSHSPEALLVDDENWSTIERLAARTYVPASEASRARGAGAGLVDTD